MEIVIHKDVQELLDELNEIDKSVIFGGYLRDMIFGNLPSDVDIVTNIPIEIIEQKYSLLEKAKRRKTTSGHDVFSFKMHRTEKIFVEIVCIESNLLEKSKTADYTLNSLLYDGINIIDNENGLEDIKNKIIREVDADIIRKDLKTRPYLWLKTLRLVSMTGFKLSDTTFKILNENKNCVQNISDEILQTEGHKTLNGKNPFLAMKFLSLMGFISPFEISKNFKANKCNMQTHQRLCLLTLLSNKQSIDDFIKFYHFQQDVIDKHERFYNICLSEEKPPSRFKHQINMIKKIVQG